MNEQNKKHIKDQGESHVHFKTEDVTAHQAEIEVVTRDGVLEVHLGFLKIRHVYTITFHLPHKAPKDLTSEPLESLYVKVVELKPTADGHQVTVEFNAHKDKLMKERITLRSANKTVEPLVLVFQARVLGKYKGTPSLRNGIHCFRVEPDDEEGSSDWQGF